MRSFISGILIFVLTGCIFPYAPIRTSGDCFDRACNIKTELRAKGYETRLIVGINGKDAHAWVEYKKPEDRDWKRIDNY